MKNVRKKNVIATSMNTITTNMAVPVAAVTNTSMSINTNPAAVRCASWKI